MEAFIPKETVWLPDTKAQNLHFITEFELRFELVPSRGVNFCARRERNFLSSKKHVGLLDYIRVIHG